MDKQKPIYLSGTSIYSLHLESREPISDWRKEISNIIDGLKHEEPITAHGEVEFSTSKEDFINKIRNQRRTEHD